MDLTMKIFSIILISFVIFFKESNSKSLADFRNYEKHLDDISHFINKNIQERLYSKWLKKLFNSIKLKKSSSANDEKPLLVKTLLGQVKKREDKNCECKDLNHSEESHNKDTRYGYDEFEQDSEDLYEFKKFLSQNPHLRDHDIDEYIFNKGYRNELKEDVNEENFTEPVQNEEKIESNENQKPEIENNQPINENYPWLDSGHMYENEENKYSDDSSEWK
ncbi:unnamed protein product [Brachionus calyciflorus]|uniref:Uncharacterized protein n=1 Tax=Brachionus calyciflorus TaxID=104777 RepID=A0A813UU75_9BILA|nr:unnamed protein product [Brachionus calyciflorus]